MQKKIAYVIIVQCFKVFYSMFQNDMVSFKDKDDVLTLLIHLGYLGYDQRTQTAFIPNEEIRQEFMGATKRNKWNELIDFQRFYVPAKTGICE